MRILHFVPDIGVANGVMSVVLNYFRAMPEDIKFDIMYFKECERDRRAEIEALGGRVFRINTPGIKSFVSSELDGFFEEHKGEYAAVHIHAPYMTCLIAPKAKKHGIKKVAAHCHSTLFSLNPDNLRRNQLLNVPTRFLADKLFACGREAGRYWYGKDSRCPHFLGRRSDISQLLSAMDVFIFPSFREGLPVSVVEAQAAGLPVLMSDTVTDEVCITDHIKRLSIDADPKVWAKEIETMPDDLRASAFEKVRDCGWDINKCAKTLVEFYER